MSILKIFNRTIKSVDEFLFHGEDIEETVVQDEAVSQTTVATKQKTVNRRLKTVNGPDLVYTDIIEEPVQPVKSFTSTSKQQPTLHTVETKAPVLQVMTQKKYAIRTFNITAFNDTQAVADALKQGKCVLLNFEKAEFKVQHRVCDFVNGACYVLGGSVVRITSTMMLYAPKGISLLRTK